MARILGLLDLRSENSTGTGNNSGGKVYFYEAGTSTPKNTYPTEADAIALTNANANPLILDSTGRPSTAIWLLTDTQYKVVIKNSADVTISTTDDVSGTFDPLTADYDSKSAKYSDGDGMADSNGNEVVTVTKTTSAVNQVNVTNAATAGSPDIAAAGDDSNISLTVNGKGTGTVNVGASAGGVKLGNASLLFPNSDGSSGQLIKTNGAGTLSFVTGSSDLILPRNYRDPLATISQDTDTDHDILISAGAWRDTTNAENIVLSAGITKQIDASWAAGDDAGGFPTGISLSSNTWYHIFVIRKTSDGSVDGGFDTSTSATNLLADATGYAEYRRVGSVLTDASSNIIAFTQIGDWFYWSDPLLSYDSTLSTTAANITVESPVGYNTFVLLNWHANSASNQSVYASPPGIATDEAASSSAAPLGSGWSNTTALGHGQIFSLTDTSSQVRFRASGAVSTYRLSCIAYRDFLQS